MTLWCAVYGRSIELWDGRNAIAEKQNAFSFHIAQANFGRPGDAAMRSCTRTHGQHEQGANAFHGFSFTNERQSEGSQNAVGQHRLLTDEIQRLRSVRRRVR